MCSMQIRGQREAKAVIDYIRHMAGVDKSDQLLHNLPCTGNRSNGAKVLFFFHLPTLCTIQTMVILNKHRRQQHMKKLFIN